jgi:hypothetical protein
MDYEGCGSSSCKLARPTGQHNNGPCRCKQVLQSLQRRCEEYDKTLGDVNWLANALRANDRVGVGYGLLAERIMESAAISPQQSKE